MIDRRTHVFGVAKTNMKIYLNELEVLKHLKYRYIVNLVGSYTDLTYLGLIMSLKQPLLRNSYLHLARIRHMDLKSQNFGEEDRQFARYHMAEA